MPALRNHFQNSSLKGVEGVVELKKKFRFLPIHYEPIGRPAGADARMSRTHTQTMNTHTDALTAICDSPDEGCMYNDHSFDAGRISDTIGSKDGHISLNAKVKYAYISYFSVLCLIYTEDIGVHKEYSSFVSYRMNYFVGIVLEVFK